jgi:hypothetical protein
LINPKISGNASVVFGASGNMNRDNALFFAHNY